MKKSTTLFLAIGVLVGGAALMFFFFSLRENTPRRTPQPRARLVETEIVKLGPVEAELTAFGTMLSSQPVELFSEARGELLAGDIDFKPAIRFRRGDLLLRIDDRQTKLNHQSAVSEFLSALAIVLPEIKTDFPDQYSRWQKYFDSIDFDSNLPTMPEVTQQKIKLYLSRYNAYKLYFNARDIEITLEKHSIVAPFDGSIVSTNLRPGSSVREGNLLGAIINLEKFEVELPMPASEISWIDTDRSFDLVSNQLGISWPGDIKRVGSVIDPRTQTVPIYVSLERNFGDILYDGTFLEATVPGVIVENAIEIPRSAVYDNDYVYLISNGVLERRTIEIVRRQKTSMIINGGLNDGDTIVTEPLQGVSAGMPAKSRASLTAPVREGGN